MPDLHSGLGEELDDPNALHLETCRNCQDAKHHGMVVHGSQKLPEAPCDTCSHGVRSLVCSENCADNHKRECICGLASSSNSFSAEIDDISVSMRRTSQAADADSALSLHQASLLNFCLGSPLSKKMPAAEAATEVVNQDVVPGAPATSPRQDQMAHGAMEGSSDNHPLKAPEDAVTALELQDSHSALCFKRSADQLVGEGADRATALPCCSHDTSFDLLIRGNLAAASYVFTPALRHDGGTDGQTDHDFELVEPLVETKNLSGKWVTNKKMEEQNDELFLDSDPTSGLGLLGSNLKGALVLSPLTGKLHNEQTLQCWLTPGFAVSSSSGVVPSGDIHAVEALWSQYGV